MKNEQIFSILDWLTANTPQVVQLLGALVPLLALLVVGYAVYAIVQTLKRGNK